jgi:hypothetical protein
VNYEVPNSFTASELNRELARKINDARVNPQFPFAGKFVGISGAKGVAVAEEMDELIRRLRPVGADLRQSLCVELGPDYDQVQEIWGAQ